MRHRFEVRVGPVGFRIGSAWARPVAALRALYAGYPGLAEGVPDFTVRLEPATRWRRFVRPPVAIRGDYTLPDAAPLPLPQALLAAEMGMNLQMALGQRRYLLLHAAALERDGRALILTGESGAGKSTLSALLALAGWRFLGDEFALLGLDDGLLRPFPRPVSLKNASIEVAAAAGGVIAATVEGTPKGRIGYMRPPVAALAAIDAPARPALLLFPRFGQAEAVRAVGQAEAFVRLTQASTNYVALGEPGFDALSRLVTEVPLAAIDYPDTTTAHALVERLWASA